MNTRIHWSIQRVRRAMYELRFKYTRWWLSQRVEFLEWQLGLETLVPQPMSVRQFRKS